MSKRPYTGAFQDPPKLRIKLADSEQGAKHVTLEAEQLVVILFSSVARGLPACDEWDISGLLVDGRSVGRATVVAWLNAAYQHTYQADFKAQPDDPACSVEGLYYLLAFADAVGTTKGLLQACCSRLERLQLLAHLGQVQVPLITDGSGYAFNPVSTRLHQLPDLSADSRAVTRAFVGAEEQQDFKQQVAALVEQLLWLAYRLQLQPLAEHLQKLVRALCMFEESLLTGAVDTVVTTRVLEAAGVGALPHGRQVLLNSILGDDLAFTERPGVQTVLCPAGLTATQQQPIRFKAAVRRTTLPLPQGATVPVELDLFGTSTIKLGQKTFPLQLRIGSSVGNVTKQPLDPHDQ